MSIPWEAIGAWPVRALIAGGAVLLVGRLVVALSRQPARRVWVGTTAVVAALLVIPLTLIPGWLPVTVSVPTTAVAPAPSTTPPAKPVEPAPESAQSGDLSQALADVGLPAFGVWEPPSPTISTPASSPLRIEAAPSLPGSPSPEFTTRTPTPAAAPGLNWPVLAACAYGMIAGTFLLRLAVGHLALARLWRRAHAAPEWAEMAFRRLAAAVCPRAELRVTARPVGPVCFGVVRRRVLIPAGLLAAGDGPAIRAVFAHELAHLGRRDPLAGWLLGVARAAYFICPWLAGLRREVRLAQECLADAEAARHAAGPADYAELLIRMARSRPAPLGAAGARGPNSELFRRVTMLLRSSDGVERRCPRRWALAVGGALTALAILAAGLTIQPRSASAAAPAPETPKEGEKKAKPAKKEALPAGKADPLKDALEKLKKDLGDDAAAQKKLDDLLKGLNDGKAPAPLTPQPFPPPPVGVPPAIGRPDMEQEIQRAQEMMRQYMDAMMKVRGAGVGIGMRPMMPGGGGVRLGVRVERPSDVLTSQLDLPAGQGLVCVDVPADSAAGKAGIKPNDILLEIGGKPVSSNFGDFHKMLADVKADTAVDVVVMRKGKKETVKGMKLPEAKPVPDFPAIQDFQLRPPVALPVPDLVPPLDPLIKPGIDAGPGETARVEQVNDAFTIFYSKNGIKVTIAGTKEGGTPKAESIEVDDKGKITKAESIEKLPKEYQEIAKTALKNVK